MVIMMVIIMVITQPQKLNWTTQPPTDLSGVRSSLTTASPALRHHRHSAGVVGFHPKN